MYVHESGVSYTLYIQNDRYAKINQKQALGTATEEEVKSLNDYLSKIEESIPELKAAKESGTIGIGVFILPSGASSTLQTAVDQTTQKMLDEGTDETILKDVLGIVKDNYSMDIEYGAGVAHIKNDTVSYDMDALNSVLDKFKAIYTHNGELSEGLGTFKTYVNDVYNILKNEANPTIQETETAATNSTDNDLVDSFIHEMEKSEESTTTGADELNKKLYKDYIKSLKSSLTGGLLQQSS